ncbi:leucine-rich repeat domain-containing protein [Arcobacter peruensis]|uniref:leucine-rich repeat domain-containing protein n=1 Tax=Arcobacter peruensis TaxID=2320140 RepID=UPI0013DEDF94|nr:leucine-rich repeat domain-containing protein [Arcobacter peruensis]
MDDLNWFNDICKWANKYNISEEEFPRNKFLLQNMTELDISNKNINEIPPQIQNLTKLLMLIADNNNIKELPLELFKLKSLCMLIFSNNEISILPDEIENLSIVFLDMSNNPIKTIPQSFYRQKRINTLYLHNTQLNNIEKDIFQLTNLHKLSFDDKHLHNIAKYINLLPNIDSINLRESNYDKTSQLIQNLGLKLEIKKWLEEDRKSDNKIVMLLKENDDDYDVKNYMEDLVSYSLKIVDIKPFIALDLFYEVDSLYDEVGVFPDQMIDLSIDIVLNTAKTDIQQAINLLDIIDVKDFRIETIDELIRTTEDKRYKVILESRKEALK